MKSRCLRDGIVVSDHGGPGCTMVGRMGRHFIDAYAESALDHQCLQHVTRTLERMFDVMLAMRVEVCGAELACDDRDADLVAVVRLGGGLRGWVAIAAPYGTARRMAGVVLGREIGDGGRDEVRDVLGEFASIFAGGLKSRYASVNSVMSCPCVMDAVDRPNRVPGEDTSFEVHCMSECGGFSVEVALHVDTGAVCTNANLRSGEQTPVIRTIGVGHESLARGRFQNRA